MIWLVILEKKSVAKNGRFEKSILRKPGIVVLVVEHKLIGSTAEKTVSVKICYLIRFPKSLKLTHIL